jgi:N-acyl-D-amino-acid deacylase
MFDIVITGGELLDGTGRPGSTGDIAIKDGRIAEIGGRITGPATRRIDAGGAIVTPGFVDPHSHYDGQVTWDDKLDPSFSNGITTTVLGNCGVGFAPVRQADQDRMISVMEGATAEDVAIMADAVREGMAAGAMGISTGRFEEHFYGEAYERVPGTYAEHEEIEALGRAMGESGRGNFQIVPRGAAGGVMGDFIGRDARIAEHRLFEKLARVSGRPVHYLLPQFDSDPEDWSAMLAQTAKARAAGLRIHAHIAARGFGMLLTLDGYHNFMLRPAYLEIAHLPRAERAAAMRDPGRRALILSQEDVPVGNGVDMLTSGLSNLMTARAAIGFLLEGTPEYEPDANQTIGAIATRAGKAPAEIIYDHLTAGDGSNVAAQMLLNYSNGDLNHVYDMLDDPNTLSSLGDGGAHVRLISDSSMMPYHLSFWARDRKRGPKYPLAKMVERITGRNALAFGLTDRGFLEIGKRADINVIDFDRLQLDQPSMKHDFPAGGARLDQSSSGFIATLLNGVVTRENDTDTGARPGRLIRANALS